MLELYNEKLVDLLASSKEEPAKLDIKKVNCDITRDLTHLFTAVAIMQTWC